MFKMKSHFIAVFVALIFSFNSDALEQGKKNDKSKAGNLYTSMDDMRKNLENIFPFLFSEQDFKDPKNSKFILINLVAIADGAKNAESHARMKENIAAKINISILVDNLKRAEFSFKNNRKSSARYVLKSAIQSCIACHTAPSGSQNYLFNNNEKMFAQLTENEKIDYLYTTRQFGVAEKILIQRIDDFEKNKIPWIDMQKTLNYLAIYLVRVNPSAERGYEVFTKLANSKKVPKEGRDEILEWAKSFKQWNDESKNSFSFKSIDIFAKIDQDIGMEAQENTLAFDPAFTINRMRYYSLIYSQLESKKDTPKEVQAKSLYYLGIINNALEPFASLNIGDAYLKACVIVYPKSDIAKRCYFAFEESTKLQNSGSGGVFLLPEDLKELKNYKNLSGL
ncbi:hypothetical protein [Fluviispira vulneris]|uniref:hypothetical protein n=1 Tax=Fluviispira vulneris TaxID=2763012 RepID=UPI0016483F3C|nr:hypothetical protein [Fluviispira vulneris]